DAVLSAARRPLQLTLGAWHKHLYIIVSARAQASEFANQGPMRIVEQPRDSRSIYEDETVFELAPGFCANCLRASLLAGPGQHGCCTNRGDCAFARRHCSRSPRRCSPGCQRESRWLEPDGGTPALVRHFCRAIYYLLLPARVYSKDA